MADLHDEHAARSQRSVGLRHEPSDHVEAIGASRQRVARLVLRDFGLEARELFVRNVGRVAHHRVEIRIGDRFEQVALDELDTCCDAVPERVLPGDRERRFRSVDRDELGILECLRESDGDAATAAADIRDPGCSRVLELERRLIHDAFGLGAWDQDGRRHTEAEPVELLGSDDVLDRNPAAPSLNELKVVSRRFGKNGLLKSR